MKNVRSSKGYGMNSPFANEPVNRIEGDGKISMRNTRRKLVAVDDRQAVMLRPGGEYQMQGNVTEIPPEMLMELEPKLVEKHLTTLKKAQQLEFVEKYTPLDESMKRAALMQMFQKYHNEILSQGGQYQNGGLLPDTDPYLRNMLQGTPPSTLQVAQRPVQNQDYNAMFLDFAGPASEEARMLGRQGNFDQATQVRQDIMTANRFRQEQEASYLPPVGPQRFQDGGVPKVSQSEYTTRSKSTSKKADSSGRSVLRKGDKDQNGGGEITLMQTFLANKGFYTGEADGVFGPKTEAAVKKYQKYFNDSAKETMFYQKDGSITEKIGKGGQKIKVDGVVGDQTRTALMYRERDTQPQQEAPVQGEVAFPEGQRAVNYRTSDYTPNNFPDSPMNYQGGLEMLGLAALVPEMAGVATATAGVEYAAANAAANLGRSGIKGLNVPQYLNTLVSGVTKAVPRAGGRSFAPKTPSAYGTRIGYQDGGAVEQWNYVAPPMEGFQYESIKSNRLTKENTVDIAAHPQGKSQGKSQGNGSGVVGRSTVVRRPTPPVEPIVQDQSTPEEEAFWARQREQRAAEAKNPRRDTGTLQDYIPVYDVPPPVSNTTRAVAAVTGDPVYQVVTTSMAVSGARNTGRQLSNRYSHERPTDYPVTNESTSVRPRIVGDSRVKQENNGLMFPSEETNKFVYISRDRGGQFENVYDPISGNKYRRDVQTGQYFEGFSSNPDRTIKESLETYRLSGNPLPFKIK